MKTGILTLLFCLAACCSFSQKVDSIYFNLYTDSLKKGFYNYINVDGKLSNGQWQPLDSSEIKFTCNTGYFKGNDLYIDSTYVKDTVIVKAVLRSNPAVWKEIVIYIRKRGFDEPLKTNDQIMDEMRRQPKKSRSRS